MTSLPIAPTSSPDYQSTITEITVHNASRNVLTDWDATVVKLADEGGGAYITIIQGENEIKLDYNELPLVNEAIDRLMMQYKAKDDHPIKPLSAAKLCPGQKWRRADGLEVIVLRPESERKAYYASPDAAFPHEEGWWYEDDGTVETISTERPDLNLVELLQP
jgi:hypothetical protein